MAFYRTYRPQVISEIDNISVREKLLTFLSKERASLPHAFLFCGPKGTGKTTAARLIAKIFNCSKPLKTNEPCGACNQCMSIAAGSNIDIFEIDAASNRGIDEIRELRERINLAPSSALYKVYIIDEVHMLTTEAFNALLKTLEEPPKHAVFVLATTDVHKVPDTISSRCTIIPFHTASPIELTRALERIVEKEKIQVEENVLDMIISYADGSFRDAVKMLEQVSFHKGTITPEVVRNTLWVSDEKYQNTFLEKLRNRDSSGALGIIEHLVSDGSDMRAFMTEILGKLHAMLIDSVSGNNESDWHGEYIRDLIRRLSGAFGEMKLSPLPQLPLELVVVEFCETHVADKKPDVTQSTHKPDAMSDSEFRAVPHAGKGYTSLGLLTLSKLTEHWKNVIETLKPYNHSVAGVLRSSRPKEVKHGIVTIEAFYPFHLEKLSEAKTREILADILKKLFGEIVKVEIVLGKK